MENDRKVLKIAELKQIVQLILTRTELDLGVSEIELNENYYWEVPRRSLYQMDGEVGALDVGSLQDDLEFVQPLLTATDQAVPLMLSHVAPLLRFLADAIPSYPLRKSGEADSKLS